MQNSTSLTNKSIKANPNEAGAAKVDNNSTDMSNQKNDHVRGSIGRNVSGSNSKNSRRRRRLFVDEHDCQVASHAGIVTAEEAEEDDDILSSLDLPLVNNNSKTPMSSPSPSAIGERSGGGGSKSRATDSTITPQTTATTTAKEGGAAPGLSGGKTPQDLLIRRILLEIRNAMTEQQLQELKQAGQQGGGGGGGPGANTTAIAAAAAVAANSSGGNNNNQATTTPNDIDMVMLADPKNWDRLFSDKKAQARLLEAFNDDSNEEQLPINEVVIPQEEDVDNKLEYEEFGSPGRKEQQWQRRWSMCSDITGFAELDVVDMAEKEVVEDKNNADFMLSPTPSSIMEMSPSQSPKPKVSGGKAARRRSSRRRSSMTSGTKKRNSFAVETEIQSSIQQPKGELHPSELFPGAEDYMERMGDVMVEARRQSLTKNDVVVPVVELDDTIDSFASVPRSERSHTSSKSGNRLRYSKTNNADGSSKLVDWTGTPSTRNKLSTKSVDFSTVSIRFYERIVGDNPACMQGPPIGIGWKYKSLETRQGDSSRCILDISITSSEQLFNRSNHSNNLGGKTRTSKYLYSVQEFEELRHNRRLSGPELVLTRHERESMLLQWGYTSQDLAKAIRANRVAQNKRRQTINNLGAASMEEAMESVSRKVQRMLGFRKLTSAPSTSKSVQHRSSYLMYD